MTLPGISSVVALQAIAPHVGVRGKESLAILGLSGLVDRAGGFEASDHERLERPDQHDLALGSAIVAVLTPAC